MEAEPGFKADTQTTEKKIQAKFEAIKANPGESRPDGEIREQARQEVEAGIEVGPQE